MTFVRKILILNVLLCTYALAIVAVKVSYGWIISAVLVAALFASRGRTWTAHGTSRWAWLTEVRHLLSGNGLIVGYLAGRTSKAEGLKALFSRKLSAAAAVHLFLQAFEPWWKRQDNVVRLTNAVHISVYAPSGAGKGRSCILPYLLTCPESCVIVDPKGENYQRTAQARRAMSHRVIRIDPFEVCGPGGDKFNPLDVITDTRTMIDDCRALAEELVVRPVGGDKDPHWGGRSQIFITALTAATLVFGEDGRRNMQFVRELVADQARLQGAIQTMTSSDALDGLLKRLGDMLVHFKDKELNSVLTTTNRHLRNLDSIPVSECMSESTFDPADLRKGRMTVYLILPFEHLRTQSSLLRMWIGSLMRSVIKGGLQEKNRVNFICDEAAALGQMGAIEDALDKYRGFGVRLQLYYQSLGQLKKCWGTEGGDQTLLSNTTQVFFGVNDHQTAEYVSNRLGEGTIIVQSGGKSTSTTSQNSGDGKGSTSVSHTVNDNWSQLGRKLLKPEEITVLDPRIAITLHPGVRPLATWLMRYDEGIQQPRPKGVGKSAAEAITLFFAAALTAVMVTAMFISPHNWR